jgi:bifunctional non-homologous end joining protein LigD
MPHADVVITHPDRVVFPAHKITKRDLVDYYQEVANTMLRHLKSRPLSVQRFPRAANRHSRCRQRNVGARQVA